MVNFLQNKHCACKRSIERRRHTCACAAAYHPQFRCFIRLCCPCNALCSHTAELNRRTLSAERKSREHTNGAADDFCKEHSPPILSKDTFNFAGYLRNTRTRRHRLNFIEHCDKTAECGKCNEPKGDF